MKRFLTLAVLLVTIFSFNNLYAQSKQDKEFLKYFKSLRKEAVNSNLKYEQDADYDAMKTRVEAIYKKHYDSGYLYNEKTSYAGISRLLGNIKGTTIQEFLILTLGMAVAGDEKGEIKFDTEYQGESLVGDMKVELRKYNYTENFLSEKAYKDSYCIYCDIDFETFGEGGYGYMYFKKVKGKYKVIDFYVHFPSEDEEEEGLDEEEILDAFKEFRSEASSDMESVIYGDAEADPVVRSLYDKYVDEDYIIDNTSKSSLAKKMKRKIKNDKIYSIFKETIVTILYLEKYSDEIEYNNYNEYFSDEGYKYIYALMPGGNEEYEEEDDVYKNTFIYKIYLDREDESQDDLYGFIYFKKIDGTYKIIDAEIEEIDDSDLPTVDD